MKVAYGPGEETVAWPTAAVVDTPWLEKMPDHAVPLVGLTIDAFRGLVSAYRGVSL